VFNAERFLAQALDSALAQTSRDIEIIVVDDGSTDASAAIADHYAASYPNLHVIHQRNQGLVAARNAGLAAASADYFALLDADDIWLPCHLAACLEAFARRPDAALVHADVERIDADGASLGRSRRHWHQVGDDAFLAIFLRHEHVCCPTAVFRRAAIDRVGAFDLRFNRLGCEDRDLWLRIASVAKIIFINAVHARYRVHAGNMSIRYDNMLLARMRLVDKFASTQQGKRLRRPAVAAVHCNLGDELIDARRRRGGVAPYAQAAAVRPIEARAWRGMLRSVFKRHLPAVR
jgi:glycosyltransferase involved in cell wall biosynthesis